MKCTFIERWRGRCDGNSEGERFLYLINVFLRFRLTDGLVSSLKHNVLWHQRQRGTVRDETEGKKAVWNSNSQNKGRH